ncbi:MAG: hypothetical protein LM523_14045, partial [Candidatus Contendobacter sp.]|nr:hypothetical protein [Candidatus Contendobacter sp.]
MQNLHQNKSNCLIDNNLISGTRFACTERLIFREEPMETYKWSSDTLFILLGAVMVLAMHAG